MEENKMQTSIDENSESWFYGLNFPFELYYLKWDASFYFFYLDFKSSGT